MSTCSRCRLFRQFNGEDKGSCFALPPVMFSTGSQISSPTPPPTVKANRPQCFYFQPLPENEPTQVKGKVTPETPGDALKVAGKCVNSPQRKLKPTVQQNLAG